VKENGRSITGIGCLEAAILDCVWPLEQTDGAVTVRQVYEMLRSGGRTIAYTTVMTVMGNLTRKGLLIRWERDDSAAYFYRTAYSRDELIIACMDRVLDALARDGRPSSAVLQHLGTKLV
jgi:predicted transcriptional regulator